MKKGLSNLLPNFQFLKINDIDSDFFSGADLIIFDVDNTLVFSETARTTKEVIDWLYKINNKYRCVCLSNSRTIVKRQKQIAELLGCEIFLSHHKKPFKRLFVEIRKKYNLKSGKVFVVGDRIFTDILFGNRNGATTVFVQPLNKEEDIYAKIIRRLEKSLLSTLVFLGYN
jgi:HAD superfamily phosphatase (TIGR01668 family)